MLREGQVGLVATLHTAFHDPSIETWIETKIADWMSAGAAGVRWMISESFADVAAGKVYRSWGECRVQEHLRGRSFDLSPDAFFQVHKEGAELLIDAIARAAGKGELLLDLYCGTGAIGIALADHFARVIGVELFEPSVEAARENAVRNGVTAEYHCGAVEKVLTQIPLPSTGMVIVVDPPRAGLHKDVCRFIGGLSAERLVYVACKPSSLLRDSRLLAEGGWKLEGWEAVDMFPQTGHIEVVGRFSRL